MAAGAPLAGCPGRTPPLLKALGGSPMHSGEGQPLCGGRQGPGPSPPTLPRLPPHRLAVLLPSALPGTLRPTAMLTLAQIPTWLSRHLLSPNSLASCCFHSPEPPVTLTRHDLRPYCIRDLPPEGFLPAVAVTTWAHRGLNDRPLRAPTGQRRPPCCTRRARGRARSRRAHQSRADSKWQQQSARLSVPALRGQAAPPAPRLFGGRLKSTQ